MKKLKLAVIGKDVSQSSSPQMHTFIANAMGRDISYDKISIEPSQFDDKIEGIISSYDGFNVTIPFKLSVIPHLKKAEGDAAVFGAVNTVLCANRTGYNTDGLGFSLMLKNGGIHAEGKRVLLLGAGGAGRSVAKKLADIGAQVFVYNRTEGSAEKLAQEFSGVHAIAEVVPSPYDIAINATGVGMHKTEGLSPVGEDVLSQCAAAVDLIYVPSKSKFLEIAEGLGKPVLNGMAMLFYQAYYAECIYFGLQPDKEQAKSMFVQYSGGNL